MTVAPCKDCEKREPGCHSSCSAYKEWRAERDRLNEAKLKERISTPEIPAAIVHEINKRRNRR